MHTLVILEIFGFFDFINSLILSYDSKCDRVGFSCQLAIYIYAQVNSTIDTAPSWLNNTYISHQVPAALNIRSRAADPLVSAMTIGLSHLGYLEILPRVIVGPVLAILYTSKNVVNLAPPIEIPSSLSSLISS